MGYREVATSKESQLEELRLRLQWASSRMERQQVRMRSEEMIKGGGDRVVDWIWRLCNMSFQSSGVPEDWRSAEIVPWYKGKVERTECSLVCR